RIILRDRCFLPTRLCRYDPSHPHVYTPSLHDALPILFRESDFVSLHLPSTPQTRGSVGMAQFRKMKASAILINTSRGDVVCEQEDRKSTRLNSSHVSISYAVFCLKQKL